MFLRLTEKDGRKMFIMPEDISMIVEIKETNPAIFVGSFVGMRNGQSAVLKEKANDLANMVEEAKKKAAA